MRLGVTMDAAKAMRFMDDMERRQLPFAQSRALNATAFGVRTRLVRRTFPTAFDLRSRAWPRATLRVMKSNKRHLRASVYDRLGKVNLALHITGGRKVARGRALAVPTDKVRRGARGVVKSQRPKAVLARKNVRSTGKSILRFPKKGKPVKLYTLAPSVRVPKKLRFYQDASDTARRAWPAIMKRELAHAIRTAR